MRIHFVSIDLVGSLSAEQKFSWNADKVKPFIAKLIFGTRVLE